MQPSAFLRLICVGYTLYTTACTRRATHTTPFEKFTEQFHSTAPYYPKKEMALSGTQDPCSIPSTFAQNNGQPAKILVLPVIIDEAPDPPTDKNTPEKIADFLFGTPTGRVTLSQYYQEVSMGAFNVTGDVKPWKRITHSAAGNNQTKGNEFTPRPDPIVQAALAAFDNDIDFTQYDTNNDGCIDHVLILHSGDDQAISRNTSDIWSHFEWYSIPTRRTYDGKTLYGGSVISAYSPIGMHAHEFAHNLGLPDLYSYGPPNKSLVGYWSLMDLGSWGGPSRHLGERPTSIDPFGLELLGWINPVTHSPNNLRYTVETIPGQIHQVLKVMLPSFQNPPQQDHYLLIESRLNRHARNSTQGAVHADDYLPNSGVLVWEIDTYGANFDGSVRPLVALSNAYPNEAVKGISNEALLRDAPFQPKPANGSDGTSSRYDKNNVTVLVESASNTTGYDIAVQQQPLTTPQLRAKIVRFSSDPHTLNSTLEVGVEITNTGATPAYNVRAEIAPIPHNPWTENLEQPAFADNTALNPGDTALIRWNATTQQAGHIDLMVTVTADGTAGTVLRDKAYIGGKISDFTVADTLWMGARVQAQANASWDWEYEACVRSSRLETSDNAPYPWHYARLSDCRPSTGQPVCESYDEPFKTSCQNICEKCALYSTQGWYQQVQQDPYWTDLDPRTPNQALCYRTPQYNSCRGEVTRLWIRDFDGDGQQELLVAYRDLIQETWCAAHLQTQGRCPTDLNPLGLSYLSMYKYSQEHGLGSPVWEFSPASLTYQPYLCQGRLGITAQVADLPGKPNSIVISGLCGQAGVVFSPSGVSGVLNSARYPEQLYGSDVMPFDAHLILSDQNSWKNNTQSTWLVNMSTGSLYSENVSLIEAGWTNNRATFGAAQPLYTLFTQALQTAAPHTLPSQQHVFHSWYQTDSDAWVFLSPKAQTVSHQNNTVKNLLYTDGNGPNTGRLMALTWNEDPTLRRAQNLREHWGNVKSSMLSMDWDKDGEEDIIIGDNGENAVHVFKHIPSSNTYESVFYDSFGGYTGTGYNPAIAVGDVDGDNTPNMVLGMGGHCSRPMMGDGVYIYGYGMVLRIPDINENNTTDPGEDDHGMGVFALATGDLNNDGKDDIAVGTQSGQVILLQHRLTTSTQPILTKVDP